MIDGLIGKKIGMAHIFQEDGTVVPVTAIEAGPCVVTQVKSKVTDGYEAVQVGFGHAKNLNKPEKGHLKGLDPVNILREFKVSGADKFEVGQKIDVSIFKEGQLVDVIGKSRGMGHAGVVKRHHFKGGKKTHGASDRVRRSGAIGSTTQPGHVLKGLRMAGHMGDARVTVQNIKVVKVDAEKNVLLLKGTLPGARNGILLIQHATKGSAPRKTIVVKKAADKKA